MKQYGAGDKCYAISWNEEIDGKELPLITALEKAVGLGMPSLIASPTYKLAYFEADRKYFPSPRFILKRDT